MKYLCCIPVLLVSYCQAQVVLDVPLNFIGALDQRGIDGISSPTAEDHLITVGYAVKGLAHWGTVTMDADTFEFITDPPLLNLVNGTLLRFRSPLDISGDLFVRVNGLNSAPLLRTDGLSPVAGQIKSGSVCEIIMFNDRFTLTAPSRRKCPSGSIRINDQVCVDSLVINNTHYGEAIDHCYKIGGRLCTWQEFYLGCVQTNPGLGDVLLNWEWIDDTANHTHTLGQAGGNSCMGQRSVNTLDIVPGATRCCYTLR